VCSPSIVEGNACPTGHGAWSDRSYSLDNAARDDLVGLGEVAVLVQRAGRSGRKRDSDQESQLHVPNETGGHGKDVVWVGASSNSGAKE